MTTDTVAARVRKIVSGFPEASCVEQGAHLSLEVRGKRFGWYMNSHHGDGRRVINCRTSAGTRMALETAPPVGYHVPKYVGSRGWVGLYLDESPVDWRVAEMLLEEAYRMSAPKSLLRQP
jgi:hypothetical protein